MAWKGWSKAFLDSLSSEDDNLRRYRADRDAARKDRENAKDKYNTEIKKLKNAIPQDADAINAVKAEWKQAKQRYNDQMDMATYNYMNNNASPDNGSGSNSSNGSGSSSSNSSSGSSSNGSNPGNGSGSNDSGSSESGSGSGFRFSDTFYRELGAAASDRKGGNLFDQQAETARNQARIAANTATDNEKQAQRAEQAAGRNINAVADERAVASQQSQDKQRINKAKTTGANTALLRSEVASDPAAAQAEKVEQQKIANERQDKADERKRDAAAYDGEANQDEIWSRNFDTYLDTSGRLARGNNGEGDVQQQQQQPAPEPETPAPETPAPQPQSIDFKAQNVINGILDGSNGANLQGGDKAKFDKIMSDYGLSANFKPTSQNRNNWEAEWIAANGGPNGPAAKAMQELRQSRAGDGGNAATNYNRGSDAYNEMIKRGGSMEVPAQGQQDQAIPAHADGTDCTAPGPALVGEEGPELVVNNAGADVVGENGPEIVQMEGGEKVIPNEGFKNLIAQWLYEDSSNGRESSNLLKSLGLKHFGILDTDIPDNKPDDITLKLLSTQLTPKIKEYRIKALMDELNTLLKEAN